MSGISSIGSSSLPNGGLSSVGASLLSTGAAPKPTPAPAAPSAGGTISPYEAQYLSLKAYDNQELMYASFLSPADALANADSVFAQAAKLLGTPGQPATSSSSSSSTANSSSSSSSTSTASSTPANVPSVQSILAASDAAAQQTLSAYANAPAGSSIVDFQA